MENFGKVERFWMDKLRSHCFATYETRMEASKAMMEMEGFEFQTGNPLKAKLISEADADKLINEQDSNQRFTLIGSYSRGATLFVDPDPRGELDRSFGNQHRGEARSATFEPRNGDNWKQKEEISQGDRSNDRVENDRKVSKDVHSPQRPTAPSHNGTVYRTKVEPSIEWSEK